MTVGVPEITPLARRHGEARRQRPVADQLYGTRTARIRDRGGVGGRFALRRATATRS